MYDKDHKRVISRRAMLGALTAAAYPFVEAKGDPAEHEGPASHNWMLFGRETAFLSHLPMFEKLNTAGSAYVTPHRFQVILQASFKARGGADVGALYFTDRRKRPDVKMFTVQPAADFVLPEIAAQPPLQSFDGSVFRGHLERGGRRITGLEKVTVVIDRVVHFRQFDPAAAKSKALQYLLFGRGPELFLAHSIGKPPDFDQILSVTVNGAKLTGEQVAKAIPIVIPSRKDSPAERLKKGETVAAELPDGAKLNLRAITEFYFEEGELLMPATFDPTPEERKAGFSE